MTSPEALAAPASSLERLKRYVNRNEREVAVAFFAGGFVFDIVTVGRIDSWVTIAQQCVYLGLMTAVLLHMLFEQGTPAPDPVALPRLRRGYYQYRSAAIHFALGALMNLYAIFFFKSSSLLVSFGFLAFLIVLLVANESRRVKNLGLHFKFALLALCYLSFAAIVVPIAVGSIGLGVFLTSMLVGALPLAAAAGWIRRRRPAVFAQARRQILLPLGVVLLAFLGSYLLRIIPPAPLSIPFIGVYHSVERSAEGGYLLGHERPWWRFWHHGDQYFRAQPGDRVYVFFRVFSPARFADRVQMRWYWEPGGRGWLLQDTIPIDIVGGREAGFRGYGFKSNYQPGRWKVEVATTDSREIGRVYFTLESVPAGARALSEDLE
ncbi:MAG TPA: DUF2914 domain-containing protein [Burkholderiales bacterium]|nr:DUF2914 domain-containing protein [Burkholderiales bacterium]